MSSLPLVIGYGNPLRADDGFGWQVAKQLAATLPAETATVLTLHQLTPELANEITRATLVVFVDVHADGEPGKLVVRTLFQDADQPAAFSHDVDAQAVLALAQTLYGVCPPAVMVSVGGGDFGYGVGLSPAVAATIPDVLAHVIDIIKSGGLSAVALHDERTESCTR